MDLTGRVQEGAEYNEINIPAEVPRCVPLDLSREGYLPFSFHTYKELLYKYILGE